MSIESRIRRLEGSPTSRCPECRDKPQKVRAFYSSEEKPAPERCPSCGRELEVILRVMYEGEGGA